MTERNFRTLTVTREIIPELRTIPSERIVDHRKVTPPRPGYTIEDNARLSVLAEELRQRRQPAPIHVITTDGGLSYFLIDEADWDILAAARQFAGRDPATGYHCNAPYLQALVYHINEMELQSFRLN